MADISKIKIGNTEYNLKDSASYKKPSGGIPASDLTSTIQALLTKVSGIEEGALKHVAPTYAEVIGALNFTPTDNLGTVTEVNVGETNYEPVNGVISLPAYPTTLPASDVSAWAKSSTKPSYTASEVGAIASTLKGAANGIAELDANGKVPSSQLPSYVDDVVEGYYSSSKFYASKSGTTYSSEITGETGKVYVDIDTNKTYRWSGSAFVVIAGDLALGTTSSTAFRGDYGDISYLHSQVTTGNPHNVTKSDVGLGNVGNFKAVSTEASQGLTDIEKSNARANIGASSFSGSYNDLSNKPSIPAVQVQTDWNATSGMGVLLNKPSSESASQGGATESLVTTGEKYTWNSKQDALAFINNDYNASTNKVATQNDIPTSLPASDVSSWAKAASKPSYAYGEIGYSVNPVSNSSTTVSLNGATPLHVVTTTVDITAVTLSANPAEGHSCHIIFANGGNSELTVALTHDSTNRICPDGADPDPLTIPVGGYVEIDFLTANSKVYVRGV